MPLFVLAIKMETTDTSTVFVCGVFYLLKLVNRDAGGAVFLHLKVLQDKTATSVPPPLNLPQHSFAKI